MQMDRQHCITLHLKVNEHIFVSHDIRKENSLREFIKIGYDKIVDLLIGKGANIDAIGSNGWTALHEAVQWGNLPYKCIG